MSEILDIFVLSLCSHIWCYIESVVSFFCDCLFYLVLTIVKVDRLRFMRLLQIFIPALFSPEYEDVPLDWISVNFQRAYLVQYHLWCWLLVQ